MFVIYDSGDEVIITTKKKEARMVKEYFKDSRDRNLDDYDIIEHDEYAVRLTPKISIE